MENSAANELKQIKIQDQVRDLRKQEISFRKRRGDFILLLIQISVLLAVYLLIFNLGLVVGIFSGSLISPP